MQEATIKIRGWLYKQPKDFSNKEAGFRIQNNTSVYKGGYVHWADIYLDSKTSEYTFKAFNNTVFDSDLSVSCFRLRSRTSITKGGYNTLLNHCLPSNKTRCRDKYEGHKWMYNGSCFRIQGSSSVSKGGYDSLFDMYPRPHWFNINQKADTTDWLKGTKSSFRITDALGSILKSGKMSCNTGYEVRIYNGHWSVSSPYVFKISKRRMATQKSRYPYNDFDLRQFSGPIFRGTKLYGFNITKTQSAISTGGVSFKTSKPAYNYQSEEACREVDEYAGNKFRISNHKLLVTKSGLNVYSCHLFNYQTETAYPNHTEYYDKSCGGFKISKSSYAMVSDMSFGAFYRYHQSYRSSFRITKSYSAIAMDEICYQWNFHRKFKDSDLNLRITKS